MRKLCFIVALLSMQFTYAQAQTDSEEYPLYHDARTDEIRSALAKLVMHKPYESNTKLREHINNLDEKITRYNISNFVENFKFFLTLDIPVDFLESNFADIRRHDAVWNIKHISAHALGIKNK